MGMVREGRYQPCAELYSPGQGHSAPLRAFACYSAAMNIQTIETDFRRTVSESVRLANEGLNRYRVFTPFLFEDGDHLTVVLKREEGRWILSDEGHTYMHLTYDLDEKDDLQRGNRQKIIGNALSVFSVEDREGELRLLIPEERYGDGLFSFIQALLKISNVSWSE